MGKRNRHQLIHEHKEIINQHLRTGYRTYLSPDTPILFLEEKGFRAEEILVALTFFQLKYDEVISLRLWSPVKEEIRLFAEPTRVRHTAELGPNVLLQDDEGPLSQEIYSHHLPLLDLLLHHFRKQTYSSRSIIWRAKQHVKDFLASLQENEQKDFYIFGMKYTHEDYKAYRQSLKEKRIKNKGEIK